MDIAFNTEKGKEGTQAMLFGYYKVAEVTGDLGDWF